MTTSLVSALAQPLAHVGGHFWFDQHVVGQKLCVDARATDCRFSFHAKVDQVDQRLHDSGDDGRSAEPPAQYTEPSGPTAMSGVMLDAGRFARCHEVCFIADQTECIFRRWFGGKIIHLVVEQHAALCADDPGA